MKKQIFLNCKLKNFYFLTVAGIINAIGVTMFLSPLGLYDSGFSGTSIFLSKITPKYFTLSLFLLILNLPFFIYGLKKQGTTFTIYAIYSVVIYSLVAFLIENVLPINVKDTSPIAKNDLLLCSIFGGLISGVGSGLAIRFGGAMDGVEVMSVIFAKKIGISVGTFIMIYNCLLYLICGIVFKSFGLPLYSVVAYAISLKTIDFIVEGLDRSKSSIIITDKYDEICKALSQTFGCGITIVDCLGYYSNKNKKMIYIVINRFQIAKMKNIVLTIDKFAYISINEVAETVKALKKGEQNEQG